jgi:hypothetical protein
MEAVIEGGSLDTSKQYLIAQYPHGVFPVASFLSAYFVDQILPGQKVYCLVATVS